MPQDGFEAEDDIGFVLESNASISMEDMLEMTEIILGDQIGQWG